MAGLGREKRRELLDDDLLADGAERAIQVAHPAIEFGPVNTAVVIISAFKESDCSDGHRRRLRIAVGTVCIRRCWHRSRRLDHAAPFRACAVLIGGDVGLTRLASRVLIVSALGAI